jgi:hypothetical protein
MQKSSEQVMQIKNNLLELARATSLVSLGSIQTRFFPHFNTAAASLFYSLKNAIYLYPYKFNNDYKYYFHFLIWGVFIVFIS